MNGGITSPSLVTIPNTMISTGGLVHISFDTLRFPYYKFRCECQQVLFGVLKLEDKWITHGAAFLTDNAQLILVNCTVDKTWNKQSACAKLIIQNGNNVFNVLCIYSVYAYTHYIYISTRGVMVIVVGNGHGDTSSNPERDWLHSTFPHGKGMNPIILPPAMGK